MSSKSTSSYLPSMRRKMTSMKYWLAVLLLGVCVWYWYDGLRDIELGNLRVAVHSRHLQIYMDTDKVALSGALGMAVPPLAPPPIPCIGSGAEKSGSCVMWPDIARLSVLANPLTRDNVACHSVKWVSLTRDHQPMDCFDMKQAKWYGGPEVYSQRWPINAEHVPHQQFRSVDYLMRKNLNDAHGPIVEPYWFNSRGVAIFVDDDRVPLHVGMNEGNSGRLCLSASWNGTRTPRYAEQSRLELSYVICQANNAKAVHTFMAKNFLGRPTKLPDLRIIRSPIWSTWARYKTAVSQQNVLQYANEIEQHGFSHSQIEIDDMYTTTYGDVTFDAKKFPDPKQMVEDLHGRGFRVTSWLTPFANLDSQAFTDGVNAGYWVTDSSGRVPALVKWWQGTGAVLDVTNPSAVKWFVDRLQSLRDDTGIDSFKFDAGEVGHLPPYVGTHIPLVNPNLFTTYYANVVAQFGNMVEMRSAYRCQSLPIFVRFMDKDSVWGTSNGLETLIPTALAMSVMGYSFMLPDMIGGNGYSVDPEGNTIMAYDIPEKELFVRWVQLTAYLPSMQFSFTPWQYDEEVIQISKEMVRIHEDRVAPLVIKAAAELIESGTPIVRPIWWIDPDDEEALAMESEFLVGDSVLVAPVVTEGARSRDIYLPKGTWLDDLRGERIHGQTWLRDYKVALHQVATFTYQTV